MLEQYLFNFFGAEQNAYHGITYALSDNNRVEKILDTPQLWGHDPSINNYIPTANNLLSAITELISNAQYSVDISTLTPLPDGLFLQAISAGIINAYSQGNKIVVRMLQGVFYPFSPVITMRTFAVKMGLPLDIKLYLGSMQSGWASWNSCQVDYCRW